MTRIKDVMPSLALKLGSFFRTILPGAGGDSVDALLDKKASNKHLK